MENITPSYKTISAEDEIVIDPISDLGVTNIVTPQILQQNYIKSANFVTGVSGWQIDADGNVEFNEGDFRGTVEVGSLHIPDEDTTANSFHVETDGDTFWGCTQSDFTSDHDNAKAFILKTGQVKFQNVSVGGLVTQYKLNDDGIFSYGDGSDGALSTSGNVTLTSDKYYTNLTINTGHTFYPAGYRIFVNGTLTLAGTGKISRNGVAGGNGAGGSGHDGGAGGTVGTALADGYLKGSVAGVIGGLGGTSAGGANGGAGTATTNSIGSNSTTGGDGGDHGGGTGGGTGGVVGVATTSNVKLIANWHLATLLDIGSTGATVKYDNSASPGSGAGGAGAGGGSGGGGGGGGSASSGGIIAIYAKNIVIGASASIEANGANGGDGGNGGNAISAGNYGGGGGGGGAGGNGGQIILVYNELTNDGAIVVTAGGGGTGGDGGSGNQGANGYPGSNGSNGVAGTIHLFNLSL